MIILKLTCLVVGLSLISDSSAQLPDITYTMGWYILPYTPMPNLYNFLQALNKKDSTTKAKKERAQKFIDKNWGKAKIQNATYVNTKEKAQMHFANLISHRAQVKVFIDEFLMKQLLKLFNNKEEKAKEYKSMFLSCDRSFDLSFYTALHYWYTYSHYHTPKAKRDALYDGMANALNKYYEKSTFPSGKDPLDWTLWTRDYMNYYTNTFTKGEW